MPLTLKQWSTSLLPIYVDSLSPLFFATQKLASHTGFYKGRGCGRMEARREGKRQKTGKGRYSTCEYRTVLRNTCQLHLPSPATVHLAFQSSLRKGWLSFPEHCHLLFKRGTSPAWTGSSASSSWLPGAIISTTTYPVSSFWISQKGLAISGPEFSLFEEDTVFVFDLNSSKHWQMLVFSRQVCNLFLPPQPHTAGLWQSPFTHKPCFPLISAFALQSPWLKIRKSVLGILLKWLRLNLSRTRSVRRHVYTPQQWQIPILPGSPWSGSVFSGLCPLRSLWPQASTQPCYHGYTWASRALLSERSGQSVDRQVSLGLHSQQWCWCGSWKIRSSCRSVKNFRRQAKRKMEVENRLTRKSGLKSKITRTGKGSQKVTPSLYATEMSGGQLESQPQEPS